MEHTPPLLNPYWSPRTRGRFGLLTRLALPLVGAIFSAGNADAQCTVQLNPDIATTAEDNSMVINVTANDNLCSPNYVIFPVTQPANGSVTIANGNSFNFTPNPNFSGCTGFAYSVNSNPEPTTANNDAAATLRNTSVTISILNNDTDPQNDPLTVTALTQPANGTAVLNANQTVTYTPNSGFSGADQFTYTVSDGNGNTSTATVRIDVRASNPGTVHYLPPKYFGSDHANNATQLWINTESTTGATGTYRIGTGAPVAFTVGPNNTFAVQLNAEDVPPYISQLTNFNSVSSTAGIIVEANVPVNVQVIQENSNGQSALTSKSEVALGTQFYAGQMGSVLAYETGGRAMISVMGTEPSTTVTITRPPGAAWNWLGTSSGTLSFTLNAGQSVMVGVNVISSDITGTTVKSDKPISVASGSFGAVFTGGAIDNGWDQLVPVEKVGSSYVIINSNSNPDVTDFVATQNGTTIAVNGTIAATINAGQYYRLNLTSDNVIGTTRKVTSSAPVYAFLNTGRDPARGENGLALVAPINPSGRGTFRFRTPNPQISTAPIAVLTNTSSMSSLKIFDVTGGANTLVLNGPTGSSVQPVSSDPSLSRYIGSLIASREYKITCDAFVQLSIIGASTAGGAISYFGGFEPSNTFAADDNITVVQNTSRTFSPLNNDVDGNGDPLTITNVSTPANGTATFNSANGTITYTPNTGYTGPDNFSYTITDGNFNFSTAQVNVSVEALPVTTVSIEVSPVADNPQITAAGGSAQIPAGAPVAIAIAGSPDNDGSETLGNVVTISNVPATLTFSAGVNNGNGTYTIPVASLPGLMAYSTVPGTFNLSASIFNTDAITCDVDGNPANNSVTAVFSAPFSVTFTCPIITFTATATAEICPGANNGSITISGEAGSVAPFGYSINNGATYGASASFTGLAPGSYQVRIRDANGCESDPQTIVVGPGVDVTPPQFTACPPSITVQCPADVPAPATLTATDNCSVATVSFAGDVIGNQTCPGRYTITRTYVAVDAANNSVSCTQTITVNDVTAPVITCPANTTVSCSASTAPSTTGTGNATATDNCGGPAPVAYTDSTVLGNCPGNYVIYRRWTSSDVCGNTASCTQTITVQDQTAPVITCPNNVTVACGSNTGASSTGTATATDNCGTATISSTDSTVAGSCAGTQTIYRKWTAVDACGNTASCTQTITTQDQTAPVITCPTNVVRACNASTAPASTGNATATDNCGTVAVTSTDSTVAGACRGNKTIYRKWKATDACGNASYCTQTITVQDTVKPVAICKQATVYLPANGGSVTVLAAAVNNGSTDNCSGIASATVSPASFSCANRGSNQVTLTVTDSCGNASSCTTTVNVLDTLKPVLSCPGNITACSNGTNTKTLTLAATDNCGVTSITYTITGATTGTGTGGTVTKNFNVGVSTITYTVKDASNNTSVCVATVTIDPLPTVTITASSINDFCNKVTLTATSSVAGSTFMWYLNGTAIPGATMSTLSLGLSNADGNYTVKATTPAGCTSTTSPVYCFVKQNIISLYVLLAGDYVALNDNNDVYNGSVGVTSCGGDAYFDEYCSVASPGAFVKADNICVNNPVNIPNRIYSPAAVTLPTMLLNTSNPNNYSNYTKTTNGTVTGNYKDLTINAGKTVTITGNIFRKITIKQGAIVTFSAADISLYELEVDEDAKVYFTNNTALRVRDEVDIDEKVSVNPNGKKVTFYIKDGGGGCGGGNEKFTVKAPGTMVANVYIPDGKLKVDNYSGSSCYSSSSPSQTMIGLFIADKIESDAHNVAWYSYNCGATYNLRQVAPTEQPSIVDEVQAEDVLVYPNPTSGQFTVQFARLQEAAVIQVTDIAGKVVENRVVEAGAGLSSTFDLNGKAPGTYIVNVKQGSTLHRTKLVVR